MKATCFFVLFLSLCTSSSDAIYPWEVELPDGVAIEGILDIDGNDTIVTRFGITLRCVSRRQPVLQREWMFDDRAPSYEWQQPLDWAFEYDTPPKGAMVTVKKYYLAPNDRQMTIHARMRQETCCYLGGPPAPKIPGYAYSYGEREIHTGD